MTPNQIYSKLLTSKVIDLSLCFPLKNLICTALVSGNVILTELN